MVNNPALSLEFIEASIYRRVISVVKEITHLAEEITVQ